VLVVCLGFQEDAAGQFFGLATPADGSAVYFATPLAQKNTTQPTHGKIFRLDASGLQLTLSRDIEAPTPAPGPMPVCLTTNAYDLFAVDVSSEGGVLAMTGMRHCSSGGSRAPELYLTTVVSESGRSDYPGALRLSPNGVWAFGSGLHSSYVVNVATSCREICGVYRLHDPRRDHRRQHKRVG
jgi:hypothetical protein